MDSIKLLQRIKREHDYYSRWFTMSLAAVVAIVGLALWWADIPLLDEYKMLVGLVMIFLAFVFFNIPYVVFRLLRRRYQNNAAAMQVIGKRWYFYKINIMNR